MVTGFFIGCFGLYHLHSWGLRYNVLVYNNKSEVI